MRNNSSSVEAMETMIKMLTQFQEVQKEMEVRLKQQYEQIGEEWDDLQYQKLGNTLNNIYTNLSANYVQVSECISRIQISKQRLESYLGGGM